MNKSRTAKIQATGSYLGTVLLCLAALTWVMKLWNADLAIPFHWKLGADVTLHAMLAKNLVENGGLFTNAFLGAPNHQELYDFPQAYFLHYLFIKFISIFSRDFNVAFNLYFLLAFPLTALTSLFAFRCFKFSWVSGILGSLLFTFLPYHFMRGEAHFFLGTYYLVPLTVLLALWICTGEPLFPFDRIPGGRRLVTSRGLISLASCVLIALDNPYYGFFSVFFWGVAGAAAYFRYGRPEALRSSGILLATLLMTFCLGLAPSLHYWHKHGKNDKVLGRTHGQSEYFGLKIAQLVLPVTGHRVRRVADRKADYNQSTAFLLNENDSASLGLIGSIGFLALLGWLMFGRLEHNTVTADLLGPLAVLNISAVLLGTIGGFGSLFAFEIAPQIRSYNRISIYIGFLGMFAVILLLERLRHAWARQTWARPVRDAVLFHLLVAMLLVFGILDQTTPDFVPHYQEIKADYESDADFVGRIEASLPQKAMIFQLPYHPFPEKRPEYRMWDYDHLRGYLHSKNLRWSYGTMKGREGDLWEKSVAEEPTKALVATLVGAGFSGVYVDRFGYADQGVQLESELAETLNTVPNVSANQRLSFFAFARVGAKVR